ncbi:MAG: MFS transporter [Chloroflexota bacterium]|nr:MFS transporter [Chloroflexota bacterium]
MTTTETTIASASDRIKRTQTAAYFASFIVLGLVMAALGPTLPGLAENTRSTVGQIGILFTAQALGVLVGDLISGRWYDRAPAHPFLAVVMLLVAVTLLLTPILSSLPVLAVVMFLMGIGLGSTDVGGNTLLVWVHRDDVGPRMNALHFFFGLGALLVPLLVALVISTTGEITWAYWLLAIIVVPAALMFMRVPSPTRLQQSAEVSTAEARWLLVFLIAAMFFLFVGAELSFGGWIYTYAISLDLATVTTAGYLTSLFWGALTLGRLLSIPIAARVRPRYILMVDIAGMILSLALPLLVPGTSWALWLSAFGFGLFMANVFPTLMVLGEHHLTITGGITGWFLVGGSLGSMTVPLLIGQRFEATGPQATLIVILATVLLAAVVLAAFLVAVRNPSASR